LPLPITDTPWPPPEFAAPLAKVAEWAAWWAGDPDGLRNVYGATGLDLPRIHPSQWRGGIVGAAARAFWGRPTPLGEEPSKLHLPVASDIATTSADLLFSEPVILKAADDNDATTQGRLDEIVDQYLHATLLESGEVCAGLGGVYLRAVWDREARPAGPWSSPVHADAALPEWSHNQLIAVTFWWELSNTNGTVVRRLERHSPGWIEHGLYVGTHDRLGRPVPLTEHPQTESLAPLVNAQGAIDTGITELTVDYVPNVKPNRLWRGLPGACHLGRSDYAGCEPLMDALDETWSSLMREIDLAKARAFLPRSMLQPHGPGQGASFDADQRYFVPVTALTQSGDPLASQIVFSQPAIRVEEHLRTTTELLTRIIATAGYSGQTFGLTGDVAMTATEATARERKSLITRDKKGLYWRPAIAHHVQVICQLGNKHFAWGVSDDLPTAQLPDAVQPTMRELSETAKALKDAEAASVDTRVRMVHPDWDEEQVEEEVGLIKDELGLRAIADADGFGGFAAVDGSAGPTDEPPTDVGPVDAR
jgi:hypothetical protein